LQPLCAKRGNDHLRGILVSMPLCTALKDLIWFAKLKMNLGPGIADLQVGAPSGRIRPRAASARLKASASNAGRLGGGPLAINAFAQTLRPDVHQREGNCASEAEDRKANGNNGWKASHELDLCR